MYFEVLTILFFFISSNADIKSDMSEKDELDIKNIEKYLVSIREYSNKKFRHICSGTILTEFWVLTSGQCVDIKT